MPAFKLTVTLPPGPLKPGQAINLELHLEGDSRVSYPLVLACDALERKEITAFLRPGRPKSYPGEKLIRSPLQGQAYPLQVGSNDPNATITLAEAYTIAFGEETEQQPPPKISFGSNALDAKRVAGDNGPYRIGPATVTCTLNKGFEGVKARLKSDHLPNGSADVVFSGRAMESEPVRVKLNDTGGRNDSFTLEAVENCTVDEAQGTLEFEVQAPRLKFSDPAITAAEVPDLSGIYQIGQTRLHCTATYRTEQARTAGELTGDGFKDASAELVFKDEQTLEATVTIADTDGVATAVNIIPDDDYSLDPNGTTEINLQAEAPRAGFVEDQPETERVQGKDGPFRMGSAQVKCEVNYAPTGGCRARIRSSAVVEENLTVSFAQNKPQADPLPVTLKDTGGENVLLELLPVSDCRVDEDKGRLELAVAAPTVGFADNQPEAKPVSGSGPPFETGQATFTCRLDYPSPGGIKAEIRSDYLQGRKVPVVFPDGAEEVQARARLKKTDGQCKDFVLATVENCTLNQQKSKLNFEVQEKVTEQNVQMVHESCQSSPKPVNVTVQVRAKDEEQNVNFIGDVQVKLEGSQNLSGTTKQNTGTTVFKELSPGEYTLKVVLNENQAELYHEPETQTITVTEQESDPYIIDLLRCQWAHLVVVGVNGKPLKGEPFTVQFPGNNEKLERTLDDNGEWLEKSPQPGECKIAFKNWYAHDFATQTGIFVALRDPSGLPMANEKFRVKLPDEQEQEGQLDQNGRAFIESTVPGEAEIKFTYWYRDDFDDIGAINQQQWQDKD